MYLIPVIDMANHEEASPHVVRWEHMVRPHGTTAAATPAAQSSSTVADDDAGVINHHDVAAGTAGDVLGSRSGPAASDSWFQLLAGSDLQEGDEVLTHHILNDSQL
jgi:hypothetical protein